MNKSQLINQTSGDTEYYTPSFIVEAARKVMCSVECRNQITLVEPGKIELDPASSIQANKIVKAKRIFTIEDDGLAQEWKAKTIWLNHPFSRKGNKLWIDKLVASYELYKFQACCITYACTSESWFQPLLQFPQCFLHPRTNYLLPDGSVKRGVTKGSVVTYLGWSDDYLAEDYFAEVFSEFGVVK